MRQVRDRRQTVDGRKCLLVSPRTSLLLNGRLRSKRSCRCLRWILVSPCPKTGDRCGREAVLLPAFGEERCVWPALFSAGCDRSRRGVVQALAPLEAGGTK